MSSSQSQGLDDRLHEIVINSAWFMSVLRAVRELALPSWCVGAGALRNLVWDHLHGYTSPTRLADVDVAYFDVADLSAERDLELEQCLVALLPAVPWEVTNQAGVHVWFGAHFGHAVEPLRSLAEAVASWPEYATSVALTLNRDDTLDIIAPHGLDDLFNCIVRRNPIRVSVETYRQRVLEKDYPQRWPNVTIVLDAAPSD